MKKRLGLVLLIVLLAVLVPPAAAKGPPDRIVITGPGIAGELVIEDRPTLDALSMGMEDFLSVIPQEIPANLGPGYTIKRLFKDGLHYTPFDTAVYHPDLSGEGGRVLFVGIYNGWTEYDGIWYAAQPEGDRVIRQILADHGVVLDVTESLPVPALILVNDSGALHFTDPASLADRAVWELPQEASNVIGGARGQALYYAGANLTPHRLDLAAGIQCPLPGQVLLETPDNQQVIIAGEGVLEVRDAATFDLVKMVAIPGKEENIKFFVSPHREWVYVLRYETGSASLRLFNVLTAKFADGMPLRNINDPAVYSGSWDTSGTSFHISDGASLYKADVFEPTWVIITPRMLRDENSHPLPSDGSWFEIATARGERVYLYQPVGRAGQPANDSVTQGGIYVFNNHITLLDHWQPDRLFAQVIYHEGRYYALQAAAAGEPVEALVLDGQNGSILAQRTLDPGAWSLDWAWLDPTVLSEDTAIRPVQECSRAEAE
ncbi:MAG: hypothetical protein HY866_18060 [Chloroflexi bacterium]|nr:hypothetical protein [Chloroflexota bacterium]